MMRRDPGGLVVLHIGLPKTGTTHLQWQIFSRAPDLTYVHRRQSEAAARLCWRLRHMLDLPQPVATLVRWRLQRTLATLVDAGKPVLVSYENAAFGANALWRETGPTPEHTAARLQGLAAALAPVRLRVVLGIRRQGRWLASRYAESSRDFPDFCQADFDRRMKAFAVLEELSGPARWLDHDAAAACLAAALGPDNLFLLPTERLGDAAAYAELGTFVGADLARWYRPRSARRPRNALSAGGDLWSLRRDGSPLALEPEIAAAIDARFAAANARLRDRHPLGLG